MAAPVRILFLNQDLTAGGAERALLNLLGRLDRERFSPELWLRNACGELYNDYAALGIPIREAAGVMQEGPRRRLMWSVAWRAWGLRRFQIVHSFCSSAWWTEPWCVRLAGVRGYVIRKSDNYLHGPSRSWEVRHRLAHRIVAVTTSIYDQYYRDTPLARKARVIWNGVDTEKYAPRPFDPAVRQRLGVPPGAGLFACVANLSPYKGQLPLLVALALAKARDLPLYVAFAGRDMANGEAQRWARELGVEDRAIFIGMVQDVPGLLAGCDGMVLLSPREGCSNAVLEAMSCGVPVVVTASGTHALLEDGEQGFVVPVGGIQEVVARMRLLAADAGLRARLGAGARARVLARFSLARMAEEYQSLYEEVLAGPASSSRTSQR
jgi:glycosyltransferase involved in cell wall biosynthesis